jgi:hypothetical protein
MHTHMHTHTYQVDCDPVTHMHTHTYTTGHKVKMIRAPAHIDVERQVRERGGEGGRAKGRTGEGGREGGREKKRDKESESTVEKRERQVKSRAKPSMKNRENAY